MPPAVGLAWEDDAGFHALLPGEPPTAATLAGMEEALRQQIRASPAWSELVRVHGVEKAEALLQQIKAGPGP